MKADRANVAIVSEENTDRRLKRLIGKHGDTLDALQELTRLSVQTATGERSRLMLDLLGYRDGQREKIQNIARAAVQDVLETEESVSLRPMNPFERKVVHDVVAEAGLYSDSSGVGAGRHVVISFHAPEDDEDEYEYEDAEEISQSDENDTEAQE